MKTLVLTKESAINEIEQYFKIVLNLAKSDDQFPVNLDDVWPLVYGRKDYALCELRKNFIEEEDFMLLQNEKVVSSNNLRNGLTYTAIISVSYLEYFIARKVRTVFDVYRKVFHRATNNQMDILCHLSDAFMCFEAYRQNKEEAEGN